MSKPKDTREVPHTVGTPSPSWGFPLAAYDDGGSATCHECADLTDSRGVLIWHDSEIDYPEHCSDCGGLIPHRLTGDGVEYVRGEAESDPESPVVQAWASEWPHATEPESAL